MSSPAWTLTPRQQADLELLLSGACFPLAGFMTGAELESVRSSPRLPGGAFWPTPLALEVPSDFASALAPGATVALQDAEGVALASLRVADLHPGESGGVCLGGPVQALSPPFHPDHRAARRSPDELKAWIQGKGWRRAAAYVPAGILHLADRERTLRAMGDAADGLLILPPIDPVEPDGPELFVRVRCLTALARTYPSGRAAVSLLPLAEEERRGRALLRRAVIARNCGCAHLLVEEELLDEETRRLWERHGGETGVGLLVAPRLAYGFRTAIFAPVEEIDAAERLMPLSREDVEREVAAGRPLPPWFTTPEIARELERARRPAWRRGFTVFLTGLSGSGKSTLARVLRARLLERGDRTVSLLDGDRIRRHLSSELTFSREHRDLNVRRVGFVAGEITRCGGVAICALIAPYDRARRDARKAIAPLGGFFLVHVATPLEVCEGRDRKGLYRKAREGKLPAFTGVSDPYEVPEDADLVLDTSRLSVDACVGNILESIERAGYLEPSDAPA